MTTKIRDILRELDFPKAKPGTSPYIEIGDIDVLTKEIHEKEKKSVNGAVQCPPNSILISKVRPGRGATAFIKESKTVSGGFAILKTNEEKCLPQFLFYQLARNKAFFEYLNSRATGATYPTVKESEILNYEIPALPSIPVQKHAIALLDQAEQIKRMRHEANKKMSELVPATFIEMFGDPLSNPTGWKMVRLEELGSLDRGKSQHRPRTAPELFGGSYPFIQTGDIANAGWVLNMYSQTYSEKGLAQSKLWPKGTLCITIAANIARTTILGFDACFPDSVVGFVPNEHSNADYVQGLFIFLQKKLEAMAPRAAQLNINLEILRGLEVPLPPVELQDEFAEVVAEIQKLRARQEQSGAQIEKVSYALSAKLFAPASR